MLHLWGILAFGSRPEYIWSMRFPKWPSIICSFSFFIYKTKTVKRHFCRNSFNRWVSINVCIIRGATVVMPSLVGHPKLKSIAQMMCEIITRKNLAKTIPFLYHAAWLHMPLLPQLMYASFKLMTFHLTSPPPFPFQKVTLIIIPQKLSFPRYVGRLGGYKTAFFVLFLGQSH